MARFKRFQGLLDTPGDGLGANFIREILTSSIRPTRREREEKQPSLTEILGREIDPDSVTPAQAGALTAELSGADRDTSFSGAQEVFDLLDIPGAFVRGVVGAGVSLAKGEFQEAGKRALSALPGSENIPKLFGAKGIRAPEGSELLADFGVKPGTTTDDEHRIRIARATGMSRAEAVSRFATFGKPLKFEAQKAFDAVMENARATLPEDELLPTFGDAKRAADVKDVLGIAVEIALDPLTYFTMGLSAAGKAAKGLSVLAKHGDQGAKALAAITSSSKLDDVLSVIRGIDIPGLGPKWKKARLREVEEAYTKTGSIRTIFDQAKRTRAATGAEMGEAQRLVTESRKMRQAAEESGDPAAIYRARLEQDNAAKRWAELQKGIEETVTTPRTVQTGAAPNLDFGRTFAERAERGQRGARFALPIIGTPLSGEMSTRGIDQLLTTVGQSKLSRELRHVPAGVNEAVHSMLTETPVLGSAVKTARGLLDVGRRITGRSGLAEIDEAVKGGLQVSQQGVELFSRELNKLSGDIRQLSKTSGVAESTVKQTVLQAVESTKALAAQPGFEDAGGKLADVAARYAATLSRTGLNEQQVGRIAAGFAAINEGLLGVAGRFGLPVQALGDESLAYMHRMITKPGLEWVKRNAKKFKQITGGLQFDAASGMFKGRTPAWTGKGIAQINDIMEPLIGKGTKFFGEDPVEATRHAIHEMHRRAGNAFTITRAVEMFGESAEKGSRTTALDLYKRAHLKFSDAEAERLSSVALPPQMFNALAEALKVQESPGRFWSAYQKTMNLLKSTVTVLFPAFHGRNMLENFAKGFFEGNHDPETFVQSAKILAQAQDINMGGSRFFDAAARKARAAIKTAAGDVNPQTMRLLAEEAGFKNLDEFSAWAHATGLFENRFTSEFGVDMRQVLKGTDAGAAKAQEAFKGIFGAPLRAGFAVASGTENWHRLAMFLDRLKKGHGRDGALDEVKRVFFDYRDIGKAESKYAKYGGFFYTFYRNNARYLVQTGLRHPQYTKQVSKLFFDDPDNPRHSWLSDRAAIRVGGIDIGLGFLPQQQFNMFDLSEGDWIDKFSSKAGDAIQQLNPLIQASVTAAMGKDLLRDKPLEYVDRSPDWTFAPKWVQDLIDLRQASDGTYIMDPKWRFIIDSVPALGRFAGSQIMLEQKDRPLWQKLNQLFTGVMVRNNNPTADSLARLDRNIERAARELPHIRSLPPFGFHVDARTEEGRKIRALTLMQPGKDSVMALAQDPEIIGKLIPHITLDKDGQPVMNRKLVTAMHELGQELYPQHWALLRAQEIRQKSRPGRQDIFKSKAEESFEALFAPSR